MSKRNVVLHVADVHKSFGGLHALSDVDLQVEEGTTTEIGAYIPSIPLDTPVVTIDEINDATTIGGSDGSIEFSWGAVVDADHYEVAIANSADATSGFTVLDADVAATAYTATGRAKGPFTVRVIAQPA